MLRYGIARSTAIAATAATLLALSTRPARAGSPDCTKIDAGAAATVLGVPTPIARDLESVSASLKNENVPGAAVEKFSQGVSAPGRPDGMAWLVAATTTQGRGSVSAL